MRFVFWTFLDILKMSIFGFLDEIFFAALKNQGTQNEYIVALRMVRKIFMFFSDFLKNPKFQKSEEKSWLHSGAIMARLSNSTRM